MTNKLEILEYIINEDIHFFPMKLDVFSRYCFISETKGFSRNTKKLKKNVFEFVNFAKFCNITFSVFN